MESCRPLMNKTRGRSRAHQAACVRLVSPRHLRRPRKSRSICRDVCAGRASPAAFAETFAQVAQVPRHLPKRLRRLRKSHGICRSVCAGRASLEVFAETFAQVALGPAAFAETFAQAAQAVKSSSGRVCLSITIVRLTGRRAPTD